MKDSLQFYTIQEVDKFACDCIYCREKNAINDQENKRFMIDGDSILERGLAESIGLFESDNEQRWDYGWYKAMRCRKCDESSIFFHAMLIAKNGNLFDENEKMENEFSGLRVHFNSNPGEVEQLFKVICDEEKLLLSTINPKLFSHYTKNWHLFEFSSKKLSPMQWHLFGPYSWDATNDLGAKILKEIWPTLVAISEARHKEWEIGKGELNK